MQILYCELYKIIRDNNVMEYEEFIRILSNTYNIKILDEERVRRFFLTFKKKWQLSTRNARKFEQQNESWLNTVMEISAKEIKSSVSSQPSTSTFATPSSLPSTSTSEFSSSTLESSASTLEPSTSSGRGRPAKSLDQCSEITKKRKLKQHNEDLSTELISQSLCQRYTSEKLVKKAFIVKAVHEASPNRVSRIKESIATPKDQPQKFTPEEALSLFLDLGLSKDKYNFLRYELKKRNHNALPSYNKIVAAKKECLPEMLQTTDTSASVPLQNLLDSTANRILKIKSQDEIESLDDTTLVLVSKWGCDGSSGQSEYKQQISGNNDENITDANLFVMSLVPLRLKCCTSENLMWKNPRPSSAHFCRPIKFKYLKETKELVQSEVDLVKQEINALMPTKCLVNGKEIEVIHRLHLTMCDGRVTQFVTDTKSSATCTICQKNPKDFRNTEEESDVEENYQYGLSPLHARIRFMEFILHMSYDLSFTDEGVRNNPDNKQKRLEEKYRIQQEFRRQLGLIIDTPKQGFGSTNDGNTARRFFEYPDITADITKVDVEIIKRFKTILNVLSCGLPINAEKFGTYAEQTEILLNEKYAWRKLTATVHKVLRHGKNIILHCLLPIGELSEEAQEAKNKDYKRYRYHNTRKISRTEQNVDLMNMLLISSDPYISSFRRIRDKRFRSREYPEEMTNLLHTDENVDNTFESIPAT